ncbi:thioredoxin [Massilia sp. Root351]|uniref:DUF899 domain-containing protein n=1 Tax=Massilia sp. Root351 TaxID=1736522 RepID=UPI00070EA3E3|nr:thioredoxin family protein [Massilia sp. Root351]KQV78578.1 thioredoxin [Massilia sp. Root351]
MNDTHTHPVVSSEQWTSERKALLEREKELMRLHDAVARERRALPWVRIDKHYVFDTPQGKRALADLFEGRRQLMVQHFMFTPGKEQGCRSCSYMADHTDGALPHQAQRDLAFVAVSRAPVEDIERFRRRMGWQFNWVSSGSGDFNYDFDVSFTPEQTAKGNVYYNFTMQPFPLPDAPGISVFYKDGDGHIYRTYSTYGRGVEVMMHTYALLDLTPKGRQEEGQADTMSWVRHHDLYDPAPAHAPAAASAACCHAAA